MSDFIPLILVFIFVIIAIIVLFYILVVSKNKKTAGPGAKKKDKSTLLKEATRKLAQNPKDHEALSVLADIQFNDGDYEKAAKTYGLLVGMAGTDGALDEYTINLRFGLSCLKLGRTEDAYKAFMIAKALRGEGFEVNYNLGYLEYQKKSFEKAIPALRAASNIDKDHAASVKYLGQSLFKIKSFKESVIYLKRAVDLEPNDKETLFYLAQNYYELGQSENAVKIFTHLRPDPEIGPQAALFAGSIHYNSRQYDAAIEDLEIGLRHTKITQDVLLEMKYRLAAAYTQGQNMDAALKQYKDIRAINGTYRDVADQIKRLSEFHSNKHLQTYMMSPTSEFMALCRNLTSCFFPKAAIKITDVAVNKNEYADITCEISTSKWDDVIMFRFIRSNAQVGELFLRDMQARLKEVHAGRGFCITAGSFTQTAKQFVEARLIDLIEKDGLLKAMSALN